MADEKSVTQSISEMILDINTSSDYQYIAHPTGHPVTVELQRKNDNFSDCTFNGRNRLECTQKAHRYAMLTKEQPKTLTEQLNLLSEARKRIADLEEQLHNAQQIGKEYKNRLETTETELLQVKSHTSEKTRQTAKV